MESESSTSPDGKQLEDEIRWVANERLLKTLRDPSAEVPIGGLMAFVSKIGFEPDHTPTEGPAKIGTQNLFAVLPGLPVERQEQILSTFEAQIQKARKELPSGG